MTALPQWAQSEEATALIAAILVERPDYRDSYTLPSSFGGYQETCPPRYMGKSAGRLRRIHRDWLEQELAAQDARFEQGDNWDQNASNDIFRVEDADKLIERLLSADLAASAIEARSDKTGTGLAEGESAAPEEDAQ